MRRSWFVFLFSIFALLFLSCKNENNVTIKGQISNLESPYVLASHFSTDSIAVDTIRVNSKGQFKYEAHVDTLTTFTLYFNEFNTSAVVFADKKQKIILSGDANLPDLIQVKGNEINDVLTVFKKENESLLKQRAEIIHNFKIDALTNTNNGVLSENDKMAKINSLNHELTQRAETFIQAHPAETGSVILINDFFRDTENPQSLERVLGYLKGEALNSPLAASLTAYSNELKQSAEGASMPFFQLIDVNNDTVKSVDLIGKYVILSFVSASGLESREDIRVLKKEYDQLNKDSVKFISVYIDSDIYPITTIGNDSLPWTAVPEKRSWASDIVNAYNIHFVPYNILISPDGFIKTRNIAAQDIRRAIKNAAKPN